MAIISPTFGKRLQFRGGERDGIAPGHDGEGFALLIYLRHLAAPSKRLVVKTFDARSASPSHIALYNCTD
jgi:hypothetical protein